MSFLLDTNVLSEIRRGRDRNVQAWASAVEDSALYLSVLTLGEIRHGIERLRNRDQLQAEVFAGWLGELRVRFADRILPVNVQIAEEWGRINASRPRNSIDSLIAATARIHDLIVVTRNTGHFEGCGIQLINPWEYRARKQS